MEKKLISVHAVTVHAYTIVIILLVILLGVVSLKYLHLKLAIGNYTASTIWMNLQGRPTGEISDYGLIIGQTAGQYISSNDLQNYISSVSKTVNRDIVVLDRAQKVLSDSLPANKGTTYTYDKGEIKQTTADGQPRSFEEKSVDYPNGIIETVVPMRNAKGEIIGAVIVSNSILQ